MNHPTKENRKMKQNSRNLVRGGGHARGRGRIQRGAWLELVGRCGLATTTEVIRGLYMGREPRGGPYTRLRRRLDAIADRVGRSRGPGRPWLWRLRPGHAPPGCWDGWIDPETGEPWPEQRHG